MKRLLIAFAALLLFNLSALSQNFYPRDSIRAEGWSQKDSIQTHFLYRQNQKAAPRFKLYPTDNMWTFIRLETSSGRIWQVHFGVGENSARTTHPVNTVNLGLIYGSGDQYNGRFELYKTENMYNFILLDTDSGLVWQVQWSYNADNRGILRIYE